MTQVDANAGSDVGQKTETSRTERLPLLYQGMLTAIVRLQSTKQELVDANAFQRRMEGLLDEIERAAIKTGYRNQDIQDAHYATIAFLDETVQRSSDPNRSQWTPLQAKRYAQAVAGEGVFDRLNTIRTRRDCEELADLLEVYELCFLLGYQGRYAVGGRAELDRLIGDLGEQIERIRGRQAAVSPEGTLPPPPPLAAAPDVFRAKWKIAAVACVAFACLTWLILRWILGSQAEEAVRRLLAP